MRSIGTTLPTDETGASQPEVDQIEQWVVTQLAVAPALSASQLGRLQMLLAATGGEHAKSA